MLSKMLQEARYWEDIREIDHCPIYALRPFSWQYQNWQLRVHLALLQLNKERVTTSSVSKFFPHFSSAVQKHFAPLSKISPRQNEFFAHNWEESCLAETDYVSKFKLSLAKVPNILWIFCLPKSRLNVWIMTIMSPVAVDALSQLNGPFGRCVE